MLLFSTAQILIMREYDSVTIHLLEIAGANGKVMGSMGQSIISKSFGIASQLDQNRQPPYMHLKNHHKRTNDTSNPLLYNSLAVSFSYIYLCNVVNF